jgi:hypothetical protein
MSCAVLFDLERGELADEDGGDDSGLPRRDASFDAVPPKGDAGVPDGSDVRIDGSLDVDRSDIRFDTPIDGVPTDTIGDAPRGDSVGDAPRADGGIDVTPPFDASIDSTPPPSDVVTVDVSPDAPRDATVDRGIDTSADVVVDTRPADTTTDPGVPCSATTCPSGCCSNNACVPYASQNDTTCGVGGATCAACPANNTCTQSSSGCQFQCSPTSCPSGCCSNNACVPYASQNDTTCGVGGATCAACPADRTCSQSSAGCVTWCGLRSAPAGVAAGDYACVDFEAGMPPANVWVPSRQEMSVLQITNVALSVPNGLESVSVATATFGNESLLRWTGGPTTTKLKKVSVSAAVNPGLFQRLDADYQILCANMSAGFPSSGCIAITTQGLKIRWRFYNGSGYVSGECDANGGFANEQWTNAEIHLDPVTGLVEAIIGGMSTSCQATDFPLEDTVGFAEVGLARDGPAEIGLRVRYDNVEVTVRR